MPITSRTPRWRALAAAVALTATAPAALAQLVSAGNGDSTISPFFRTFVFGGISPDGSFGFPGELVNGLDYRSNNGPRSNTTTFTETDAGATMYGQGSAYYAGFYAGRNYASMTVENASADAAYYLVAGTGTTTSVRFFTEQAAQARATFTWRVTGQESNSIGAGQNTSRIDFHATTEAGGSWFDLFNGNFQNTLFEYGPGTYTYTLPVAPLGTEIFLHYWSAAYTQMNAGLVPQGSNFTLTANYANTFVLENVTLTDEAGALLTDWSMVDDTTGQTVFDETGRLAPVTTPVPEPGTWAMLLAGLAVMGGIAKRRAAAH